MQTQFVNARQHDNDPVVKIAMGNNDSMTQLVGIQRIYSQNDYVPGLVNGNIYQPRT